MSGIGSPSATFSAWTNVRPGGGNPRRWLLRKTEGEEEEAEVEMGELVEDLLEELESGG